MLDGREGARACRLCCLLTHSRSRWNPKTPITNTCSSVHDLHPTLPSQHYTKHRGKTHVTTHYLKEAADEVFYEFVNNVATAERPLYFHTDDSRLRAMFVYLKDQLSSGQPSIMPFQGKESEGAAWIEALQRPEFNGACTRGWMACGRRAQRGGWRFPLSLSSRAAL